MGRIDRDQLNKELGKGLLKIEKQIIPKAISSFNDRKQEMIDEFNQHLVTLAIEEGPEAENDSSGLLNGKGNLFSFIGFEVDSTPTEIVREILKNDTEINPKPKLSISGNKINYNFDIKIPSKDDIASETPLPWSGRSWILGIERGISGLGHYIFHKFFKTGSRSTTGLQNKKQITSGTTFKRSSYISEILNNFKRNINK